MAKSNYTPIDKIIKSANLLGIESYGSPTLSDQALLDFPSVKIGPGNSKRSHSADEYIYVDELLTPKSLP